MATLPTGDCPIPARPRPKLLSRYGCLVLSTPDGSWQMQVTRGEYANAFPELAGVGARRPKETRSALTSVLHACNFCV